MKLATEMGDVKGYAMIHKQGCRDLRDPEPMGEHTTRDSALDHYRDVFGWEWEEGDSSVFSPCVKF